MVKAGAKLVGIRSASHVPVVYPACDDEVARRAEAIWGRLQPPIEQANRGHGKGRVVWGQALYAADADEPSPILQARWIWEAQGNPASAAPVGSVTLRRQFHLPLSKRIHSARLEMTADNGFRRAQRPTPFWRGATSTDISADVTKTLRSGTNVLTVVADNGGEKPNPAGLIGALKIQYGDRSEHRLITDEDWIVADAGDTGFEKPVRVLGDAPMSPWRLTSPAPARPLYPHYEVTAAILRESGVSEDFVSPGPRVTPTAEEVREIYFVANRSTRLDLTRNLSARPPHTGTLESVQRRNPNDSAIHPVGRFVGYPPAF